MAASSNLWILNEALPESLSLAIWEERVPGGVLFVTGSGLSVERALIRRWRRLRDWKSRLHLGQVWREWWLQTTDFVFSSICNGRARNVSVMILVSKTK